MASTAWTTNRSTTTFYEVFPTHCPKIFLSCKLLDST
uniref:Uncharacterized protein n=1 Tax=Romanomermis culicivorax TaxID=13658 RepID=A0A915K3T8_ROMCU